jgi:hypothetical protein
MDVSGKFLLLLDDYTSQSVYFFFVFTHAFVKMCFTPLLEYKGLSPLFFLLGM